MSKVEKVYIFKSNLALMQENIYSSNHVNYNNSIFYRKGVLAVGCSGHKLKHFKLFVDLIRQGKYEKRN